MISINELAKISGVSTRTLRYYDQIGLLKPSFVNPSLYRMYSQEEVDKLQQILLYKACGFPLQEIKKLLQNENFNRLSSFQLHREYLLKQMEKNRLLLVQVEEMISSLERNIEMSNEEKFKNLKRKMIQKNDRLYGDEVQKKWTQETKKASDERFMNMSRETFERAEWLSKEIIRLLLKAYPSNNLDDHYLKEAVMAHQEWLKIYWPTYSVEAHLNIADMYLADARFQAYYDEHQPGLAKLLRDGIYHYLGA